MGGVKGDGRGNDEVDFYNFVNPHPPTRFYFLTLTAVVTGIIFSVAYIANPGRQTHQHILLCRRRKIHRGDCTLESGVGGGG